jgi:glycosyltransferase involved in cell wall biosynthesis
VNKLKLGKRVHFIGEVKEEKKYALIDNSLAVVLTSHYETDPIVLKEAMARGKPVIVSNNPPFPYLIKHLRNGFVVSNEKELARAVSILMRNKALRNRIEINNKEKAKIWRWSIVGNKVLELYISLLKGIKYDEQ